jgi:hypothetical protein
MPLQLGRLRRPNRLLSSTNYLSMPKFNVKKSITINAPIEKIHAVVRDFKQWPGWSPWLIAEPDCTLSYAEDGRSYSWDGKIVGSGENGIVANNPPASVDYRLVFIKPWKSVASASFELAEVAGGVRTTWSMESSIPFFLFWMKNMMASFIGMDYQRGLEMLKDYVETGSVPSKLEFVGREDFREFTYVGVKAECSSDDIGETMTRTMEQVKSLIKAGNLEPAGRAFSLYHKFDPIKKITIFTSGYPVAAEPSSLPSGMVTGTIKSMPVYSVKHTGPYRHLGNVWAAGMMHERAKVFRQNKKIGCLETYANEPGDTAENDLVTTVHLPAK